MSNGEKLEPKDIAPYESDILRGLLEAAEDQVKETTPIEIRRSGKIYFSFRIHSLSEPDYNRCRERATTYSRKNKLSMKLPEDTNSSRFRSLLIYEATIPEDRAKLWDNKKAWEQLGVLNGPDLIDKVMKAGEKDAIIVRIDEISGYLDETISGEGKLEETSKN